MGKLNAFKILVALTLQIISITLLDILNVLVDKQPMDDITRIALVISMGITSTMVGWEEK
jgi:hypothetical protein